MVGMFHAGVRPSLVAKGAAAAGLVVLADLSFFDHHPGFTLGAFAMAFVLALAAVQTAMVRDRRALTFLAGALVMGLVMIDQPTFTGWLLFVALIGMASLSPRAGPRDDAWRWFQRLFWQAMVGSVGLLLDLLKLTKKKMRSSRLPVVRLVAVLIVPLLGGLLFLGLFAAANPVIADLVSNLGQPDVDIGRVIFWGVFLVVVWGVLRPRFLRHPLPTPGARGDSRLPGVSLASVTLSLVVFNALFALQNGLDIAFLWSGARLPQQFTLAQYVHAGVFPLMASALATAVFVLVALRPGSEITASPLVRLLVGVWVAQNLFVVASSAYRMWLYVESYSLTRMRILVLIWMALVAIGLAAILWRSLKDATSGWLLNLNAQAFLLALFGLSVVDIGAVAAQWNLTHAKDINGRGVALDVCYLARLEDAALIPILHAERRPLSPRLRDALSQVRAEAVARIERRHSEWQGWTWRGQRRLDIAYAVAGPDAGRRLAGAPYCSNYEMD
jgi:hypothetical protein